MPTKEKLRDCLKELQRIEREQFEFFSEVLKDLEDEHVRGVFEELLQEEARHGEEVEALLGL